MDPFLKHPIVEYLMEKRGESTGQGRDAINETLLGTGCFFREVATEIGSGNEYHFLPEMTYNAVRDSVEEGAIALPGDGFGEGTVSISRGQFVPYEIASYNFLLTGGGCWSSCRDGEHRCNPGCWCPSGTCEPRPAWMR